MGCSGRSGKTSPCSSCSIPLPLHFICWAVYQPPVHWPSSSILTATLGPTNPDSATKSLPPASFLHAGASPETALPSSRSSLRQVGSRLMVSHGREKPQAQPLLFMLEAQRKRKRQSWDLICPGKNTASAQRNLWHCPSVSSQVRGTLGRTATGKEGSTARQSQGSISPP